jgi:hypothetical protein
MINSTALLLVGLYRTVFPLLLALLHDVFSIYTENRRAISPGVILAMCRLMSKRLRVSRSAMVTLTPL